MEAGVRRWMSRVNLSKADSLRYKLHLTLGKRWPANPPGGDCRISMVT